MESPADKIAAVVIIVGLALPHISKHLHKKVWKSQHQLAAVVIIVGLTLPHFFIPALEPAYAGQMSGEEFQGDELRFDRP